MSDFVQFCCKCGCGTNLLYCPYKNAHRFPSQLSLCDDCYDEFEKYIKNKGKRLPSSKQEYLEWLGEDIKPQPYTTAYFALEYYKQGISQSEISIKLNVSRQRVNKIIKQYKGEIKK